MLSACEFIFYLFGERKGRQGSRPPSTSSRGSRPDNQSASEDEEVTLPTPTFIELASFLLTHDRSKPPSFLQDFEQTLLTADHGAYKHFITFQQFASLPIAQSL